MHPVASRQDIPTEPIGSIPRPVELIEAAAAVECGTLDAAALEPLYADAVRDTLARFEATGSPVVTDGEQRKYHNFASYCVHNHGHMAGDGFTIHFVDHVRQLPRLTQGPFRYTRRADAFLAEAQSYTRHPVKQAVIAPSAISLFYPREPIAGYARDAFLADVVDEHVAEVAACLAAGAHTVQVDFTEGRLACKLDPGGQLLARFIQLNNLALRRFGAADRARIGVHTCPGGDRDSTHSADVDYVELLPSLFELDAGRFFVALAREKDRRRVLEIIRRYVKPWQQVFVGVIDPLDPVVETPEQVCDRVLEAAEYIPIHQLGSTDDCGFAPFSDDRSTPRETAFEKIHARVLGTAMAASKLRLRAA